MTVADLERLFDYNYWANRKLLAVVAGLTPEQFVDPVAGSYGSVRNTLVHILSAEWGWLDRCGGHTRGPALVASDFPTFASVTQTWADVEGWMRTFLAGLTDADIERVVEFTNPRGETRAMKLGELMQHAAVHAVHHRGQVALLLRALGSVPGNFDLLLYDGERNHVTLW
jgi:uncharacterized damage-inducible protein DinB